ncbi:MAG TPA: adenylate/guanylate cyclase domain-containing protein [Steroidobacteraceae bacterium]|nr:adenylate/guanylate cyclase domain-containing protein [Gammaproteobacteria bacterium]HEV2285317.1 adenylate/guanylate cyclase domain-containing protein [Steroidobacteraceae bacterium]
MSVDEPLRARIEALLRAGSDIRRREELLRQTFRRYVSPRVADKILEDTELRNTLLAPSPPLEMRAHAVVLFADLRGFTSIAEQLDAQHIVPLLNEFFSLLTEITFKYDGTVFHMAGDCLMLGFGVPTEQPDSPQRAVSAAREMLARFAELSRSWRARHQIEAGLGIGINEGDVVAGNIGSSAYMNYTIIGDTVNIAARLCQRARAGEMLFSSTLKRSLDEHGLDIGATPLPPLQLRGRSHPIDIFCVPLGTRIQLAAEPAGA